MCPEADQHHDHDAWDGALSSVSALREKAAERRRPLDVVQVAGDGDR